MSYSISDEAAQSILSEIVESQRLRKLTDRELIKECLRSEIGDDLKVQELLNRVLPGWDEIEL